MNCSYIPYGDGVDIRIEGSGNGGGYLDLIMNQLMLFFQIVSIEF